jgi:hypothetical protein
MKRAAPVHRSRIHLLAAREAPVIVILQRKRAKLFHVITVHTEKHWIGEGSWFRGVLYALDSDVSFDGKFMVYRARGANTQTWTGLPLAVAQDPRSRRDSDHGRGLFFRSERSENPRLGL